jgi:hypothetical protein
MTKPLHLDEEAVEELESTAQWYEGRRQDLGIDFVAAIREALLRISNRPRTWPLVAKCSRRNRSQLRRHSFGKA